MRALILVAGAALAVAACSSNNEANNTMNVEETNLPAENMAAPDMNAPAADMNGMNMGADTNAAGVPDTNAAHAEANNAM